ncbi:MAG: phenylalanine--tRNA ligase subunit beta [Calditrichaeota bacterium]|nr:MAG: phenylalanine--tRNA ligase subunit beta [Calditrichota bacterium]MBL1204159.1 phenylalanine--tRNA ligase subunit beta [Calditrichota bacterium]NOG43990.1 phenylalanine--tRNA ligase subunit beta [Calditrichota bacterium]
MKISYKWLKEYIDIDISIEELAQKITDSGVEVEEIIPLVAEFNNIVLGKVESVSKHPDADKLSVCTVSTGNETFQVICGAPNVEAGQLIPFAQPGAKLPNGIKIKKAKIRGVESFGMICSKEELGFEEASEGIWPLNTTEQLGSDINTVLADYKDYIFDLFITSNRPDCLSHVGIAREVAAFTGKKVNLPKIDIDESDSFQAKDLIKVNIDYTEGCPRYATRVIKNVKIGPSPEWLKTKLEAIGSRSINNVVDVTNFVLNELGQPLHAFDYDLIEGHQINVKNSTAGSKFTTLDEKERLLPENTVMICDGKREVAIGGIMGGMNSEVSDVTTNILLESAYFTPKNIVTSTRKLSLMTDASQRFEKGTDYDGVIYALDRAAQLIKDLAGGEIASGIIDEYPQPINPSIVPFSLSQVNRILGSTLDDTKILNTLKRIDLIDSPSGIQVPSYRVDIKEEIDLVEEVARLINLDNLPTSTIEPVYLDQPGTGHDDYISLMRETLIEIGLQEIFTNSMISTKTAAIIPETKTVKILNPISDDLSVMRPSLLPGILSTISHNFNRQNPDLKIFEIGRIFSDNGKDKLPLQPINFAFAISGKRNPDFWGNEGENFDFYDLKGIIESLFEMLNISIPNFDSVKEFPFLDKDFSVQLSQNGQNIGYCGRISNDLINEFDLSNEVYFAELNFDLIIKFISDNKKYKTIGKYPYIEKDLALVLENNILANDVISFIYQHGGKFLRNVNIFDVYSGDKISSGHKSLAIRLRFQSDERTLKDKEIDKVFKNLINKSKQQFNASLRDK